MKEFIAIDIKWAERSEKIGLLDTKYVIRADSEKEAVEKLMRFVAGTDQHAECFNYFLHASMVLVDTRWGRVTYRLFEPAVVE